MVVPTMNGCGRPKPTIWLLYKPKRSRRPRPGSAAMTAVAGVQAPTGHQRPPVPDRNPLSRCFRIMPNPHAHSDAEGSPAPLRRSIRSIRFATARCVGKQVIHRTQSWPREQGPAARLYHRNKAPDLLVGAVHRLGTNSGRSRPVACPSSQPERRRRRYHQMETGAAYQRRLIGLA